MIFYMALFHGLKLGFEYMPYFGNKGTLVLEVLCLRAVFIFGVENESDVQNGD